MSEKSRVIVCLPSYNEAGNLQNLIRDIHHAVPDLMILVVDDGSVDATAEIARKAAQTMNVVLAQHEHNMGLGQAYLTGFKNALDLVCDNGFVIIMDADGTHRPEQIADLISKAEAGADLVVAGRYIEGSSVTGVPYYRRILSYGVRMLSRMLLGNSMVKDVTCGYRLYKASLIRRAQQAYGDRLILSNGFTVTLELLVKMQRIGGQVDQIPLNLRYDIKKGTSKIKLKRTIVQYLYLFWQLALTRPRALPNDG